MLEVLRAVLVNADLISAPSSSRTSTQTCSLMALGNGLDCERLLYPKNSCGIRHEWTDNFLRIVQEYARGFEVGLRWVEKHHEEAPDPTWEERNKKAWKAYF